MASSKSTVYFSCLVLLALVAPTLAVNRLFVDKISGYHQELVTAQDIDTDLLRTTLMVVGAGVDMTSDEDHVIDTVGSIALDGTDLTITATNNIDIASFGGNVRFAADSVGVSANQGGVISAVEATVHADSLSLSYGTFDVDGADTTIRSLGDIDFNGTNLEMDAADRVGIIASTVDMSFGGDFSASSDQSNLRVNAGKLASFASSQSMSITGQSGVDVISFHDDLALSSSLGDATFTGENVEIRGLHSIGLDAIGDADYTAEFINTNSDSIHFVAADEVNFEAESGVTLAANGHALVSGSALTAQAEDITVNSARDLVFLSGGSIDVSAGGDFGASAATIHASAGDDLTVTSAGALSINSGYQVNINSDHDDVIFSASSAGLTLDGSDLVSLYSDEGTFTLQADAFNVQFEDSATFQAENSVRFFADGDMTFNTESFDVDSQAAVALQSTQDITFSGDSFRVLSSRDISLAAANTVTVDADDFNVAAQTTVQASADSMSVDLDDELIMDSEGDVALRSNGDFDLDVNDNADFEARFLVVGSEDSDVHFDSALDVDVDTRVSFEALAGSEVTIDAPSVSMNAFLFDVSSDADSVVVTVSNDADMTGVGGQLYTSTGGNTLEAEDITITADDVFSIFQETVVEATTINFNGDSWEFSAAIDREGTVTINSGDLDISSFSGNFIGGQIDIDITNQFTWTSVDLLIQSGNGQDITNVGDTSITFNGGSVTAVMPFITYEAGSMAVSGDASSLTAAAGSILVSTATTTTIGSGVDFTASASAPFSTGLISGANGVTLNSLADMFQVFGSSFVQNASGDITYSGTNLSMDFVDASTITVTTDSRATYSSPAGPVTFTTNVDQVYDGTDTDVVVTRDMTHSGDEINFISRGLVSFDAGTSLSATVAGDHNVLGGDIVVDASVDLIYNVASLSFGAPPPVESNPNDGTVTVDAGDSSTFTFGELVQMAASGNNPYVDEAITMLAESGNAQFLANSALNGLEFNGNNGVNVTTTFATVTSQQGVLFHARTGSFIAEGFGDDPDVLTLVASDHDVVTPGFSLRAQADLASIVTHAHDDIDVTTGNFEFSGLEGIFATNYDSGAMTHQVTGASYSQTSGGNYVASAGERFFVDSGADVSLTMGGDLFVHSLFDDAGPSTDAIEFDSRSPAPTAGTAIDVTGGFYGYPSGTQSTTTATPGFATTITAGQLDYGYLKLGSKSGAFQISAGNDLDMTSAGHISVLAGGVDGHVHTNADGDSTITAGADFIVTSAADSQFINDDGLTVQATRTATFSSDSETEGISQVGDNMSFISNLPAGATDGISVSGHYVVMRGDDAVLFQAPEWTIGENNQQHNPVVLVNADGVDQTTVGTAQYTVANNLFSIESESTELSADSNVLFTSGGDQVFETTWATGVAGEGLLSLEAANGQVTVNADNTIEAETATGHYEANVINIITQGNSPSSNIVMQANYNINIVGDVDMDVQTNAHFVTGAVDFEGDDMTLTSSAGTFDITSDHDIDVISTADDVTITTSANNAHIEMQTLGDNSDITLTSGEDTVLTAAGDAEFIGDSIRATGGDTLVLEATSTNNGKLQMAASGETRISAATGLNFLGGDDIYFDAVGEDSTFEMDIGNGIAVSAGEELHFENNPGDGGSIIFRSEDLTTAIDGTPITSSVNGDNWTVDMDGDFLVETQGEFTMTAGTEFDITVGGYTDIFATAATIAAEDSSVFIESNAASIRFASQSFVGLGGDIVFVAEDGFTNTVVGNRTDAYNFMSAADVSIVSENSVSFNAYDTVEVSSLGYANFRALNSIDVVTTFPGGDIFCFGERMEIDAEHILVNVTAGAGAASTLTRSVADQNARDVSGSIKILNDAPYTGENDYFSIAYWNFYEFFGPPVVVQNNFVTEAKLNQGASEKEAFLDRVRASMPQSERDYWVYGADYSADSLNIFKGALELSVDSEQGDLRFEYAQDLLLASNQITGVSTGGIEVHAYGEGRRITAEYDDLVVFTPPNHDAIIFGDLSSLNFRTDNAGSGEIRVQSEAGSVFVATEASTVITAGNDNLYFSSAGTVSILNLRDSTDVYGNGEIDFDSAGDLSIRAFDDDINVYGRAITFGALANDALTFTTSAGLNGVMDVQIEQSISGTLAGDVSISSSAGDVYFTAACGSCFVTDMIFTADTIEINHADDAFFEYSSSLTVAADRVVLDALPNQSATGSYGLGDSGVVRFDGRKGDDSTDSDREVFRPTVFFSDELALQFDSTGAHDALMGGYCEFDRAISFEESGGYNNAYAVCICLDHTWQCRYEGAYDVYIWAPNPYAPSTYYPN